MRREGGISGSWYPFRMNTDQADPADLAALRAVFDTDDGSDSALGWEATQAFEAEHGIVLPEPYRTFIAEISDGSYSGPPEYGLLSVAKLPDDWGGDRQERILSKPFPLAEARMWEDIPDGSDTGHRTSPGMTLHDPLGIQLADSGRQ